MAKYTELLVEYLNRGHSLPSNFTFITNFANLFVERFCNCEIGFESEELFKIKLELKADIVIPFYVEKINLYDNYIEKLEAPAKNFYEKVEGTYNMGAQKASTTELPIDATSAEPNAVNESDAYENTDAREVTRTEDGQTADEALRIIQALKDDRRKIVEMCLDEFKPLFMQVY